MLQSRDVTLRRCKVKQFNPPNTYVEADFLGLTYDTGCDRCGGGDSLYAVVRCDGALYVEVVHRSRVEFEGPAPYGL